MPNPFKRFIAIGCTHGSLVDQDAFAAVMGFVRRYRPHTRVHLGDVCDYAAFRSGARGTSDEAAQIGPDIEAGAKLIAEYRPTHVVIGNHDVRVFKQAASHNAIVALAASAARNEFLTACEKAKVQVLVDSYDIRKSRITLGDTTLCHGWMYSQNALIEHAEHFGKCIIAHLHTPGIARGRRSDSPTAHCVGMLADANKMEYAHARRATAKWGLGFCWGEYSDTECFVNLSQCESGRAASWRMPF